MLPRCVWLDSLTGEVALSTINSQLPSSGMLSSFHPCAYTHSDTTYPDIIPRVDQDLIFARIRPATRTSVSRVDWLLRGDQ